MEIFPTAYFGSVYYFRQLIASPDPGIEGHEHFVKQTGRTRCSILGANGIQHLSVPVIRPKGSKTPMNEVEISFQEKWQKDHWKSIESAYASAPYFEAYDREVKALIYQKEINLLEFNRNILNEILKLLDIEKNIGTTDHYSLTESTVDYRSFDFDARIELTAYHQVFATKENFVSNLSVLDLLFCEGPMARHLLL